MTAVGDRDDQVQVAHTRPKRSAKKQIRRTNATKTLTRCSAFRPQYYPTPCKTSWQTINIINTSSPRREEVEQAILSLKKGEAPSHDLITKASRKQIQKLSRNHNTSPTENLDHWAF